jgi:predicted phosphodiesterase
MGTVIFSDVHADATAIEAFATCIRSATFRNAFGKVDMLVNLGDLLHRGDRPKETLEKLHTLSLEFPLKSVLGNHDHAYLHGLQVSGSDSASTYRHEQLRDSPLLSIFDHMGMEWICNKMLFVHGGPLELGPQTLRLKCWQRLSHHSGDFFTGYHYTAPMAFEVLESRGLRHMCCGHQHQNICCRKLSDGVAQYPIEFFPICAEKSDERHVLEASRIALDVPSLLRVGGCHGEEPEFAYTDFSTFSFIRILNRR